MILRLDFEEEVESKEQIGVILYPADKGFLVTNQTGGYAHHQPIVSVSMIQPFGIGEKLPSYFINKLGGWGIAGSVKEEDADQLDKLLDRWGFRMDREKLNQSEEAWLYCLWNTTPIILTWMNSD